MKIIVGLGNIGEKYESTRHNAGFMAIDRIKELIEKTENFNIEFKEEKKFNALFCQFEYKKEKIILVKPTTYMNNSGIAVSAILNFYKEQPNNLIVIYDDIDLPLGTYRIREKGSAGTHNGMRSIIGLLGTENFKRMRIGIESRGETSPHKQDLASFVLSKYTKEEKQKINTAIDSGIKEII